MVMIPIAYCKCTYVVIAVMYTVLICIYCMLLYSHMYISDFLPVLIMMFFLLYHMLKKVYHIYILPPPPFYFLLFVPLRSKNCFSH